MHFKFWIKIGNSCLIWEFMLKKVQFMTKWWETRTIQLNDEKRKCIKGNAKKKIVRQLSFWECYCHTHLHKYLRHIAIYKISNSLDRLHHWPDSKFSLCLQTWIIPKNWCHCLQRKDVKQHTEWLTPPGCLSGLLFTKNGYVFSSSSPF